MKFTGPNGNILILPANGVESASTAGKYFAIGERGYYWSSSKGDKEGCFLDFSAKYFYIDCSWRRASNQLYYGGSVRLCKKR